MNFHRGAEPVDNSGMIAGTTGVEFLWLTESCEHGWELVITGRDVMIFDFLFYDRHLPVIARGLGYTQTLDGRILEDVPTNIDKYALDNPQEYTSRYSYLLALDQLVSEIVSDTPYPDPVRQYYAVTEFKAVEVPTEGCFFGRFKIED
jgi:hypothetical protein